MDLSEYYDITIWFYGSDVSAILNILHYLVYKFVSAMELKKRG